MTATNSNNRISKQVWYRTVLALVVMMFVGVSLMVQPAVAEAAPTGYQFVAQNAAGQPLRWNPDRPIRYVVNVGGSDARRATVGQALSIVAQATGVPFQYAGDTTYVPTVHNPMPAATWNAPHRDTPYDVIIAFTTESRSDMVAGNRRGLSTQRWTNEFLHGTVVVDTDDTTPGWGIGSDGSVLLHELAHLVGLAHVGDPSSLMYPTDGQTASFSRADWEGLRRVGNGRGLSYDPSRFPATAPERTAAPAPAPAAAPKPTAAPVATAPAPAAPVAAPAPAPAPAPATTVPAPATTVPAPTTTVPAPAAAAQAGTLSGDEAPMEALLGRAY